MFTGIVVDVGTIIKQEYKGNIIRAYIKSSLNLSDISLGDSIAIDGVCLTVVDITDKGYLCFDVGHETMQITTLGLSKPGQMVNIEPAMKFGSRLDGHLVQGHIDSTATIIQKEQLDESLNLTIAIADNIRQAIIHKGSIAVNGVSLTVNKICDKSFTVQLLPYTVKNTNFQYLNIRDKVNIETDIIGKYIQNLSLPYQSFSTKQTDASLPL